LVVVGLFICFCCVIVSTAVSQARSFGVFCCCGIRICLFLFCFGDAPSHPGTAGNAFDDAGRVLPAHDAQDVEQVGDGAGLAMARLPQVQNVLGRTRLGRKVVDVPDRYQPIKTCQSFILSLSFTIREESKTNTVTRTHFMIIHTFGISLPPHFM